MIPPIQVESISKCYRIFQNPHDRFKQALLNQFQNMLGRKNASPLYREHWALRDVSFELQAGEAVGILGRNGAGKSTLLQIIAGTLEPTSGQVKTFGRITALLELGSGFNPEFTGRENVFLNAQIIGLSWEDTLACFDDIASFADIGDFIEQPVKTYSSGMIMRLAFAVQTVLEPNIMIVDEALSVGDAKFQEKCFRKLRQLRSNGTTILFVSHDTNAIASFCDRTLLMENGYLVASGNPKSTIKTYMETLYGESPLTLSKDKGVLPNEASRLDDVSKSNIVKTEGTHDNSNSEYIFGNQTVEIMDVVIIDESGRITTILSSGERYRIVQKFKVNHPVSNISSGIIIRNYLGQDVFGVTNKTLGVHMPDMVSGQIYEIDIVVDMHLAAGDYFLQVANAGEDGTQYDCRIDVINFKVIDTPYLFTTSIVNLSPVFKFKLIKKLGAS